jgi:3-deoxy-7-phosphoheptulonate synthase
MLRDLDDVRIEDVGPLVPPACVMEDIPLSAAAATIVRKARQEIEAILNGEDDRLVVVVGPCSVHDVAACKEYALKLRPLAQELSGELLVIMRVYFEVSPNACIVQVLSIHRSTISISSSCQAQTQKER